MQADAKCGKNIECDRIPAREEWFVASETSDFLVVVKGSGLPSAPLNGGGLSVFESVSAVYPDILSVHGIKEGEGGLVHRIDAETCGLLLIARKDEFFRRIEECRSQGSFIKKYTAYSVVDVVDCGDDDRSDDSGTLPKNNVLPNIGEITSRFRPFGKKGAAVKPVFDEEAGMADRKKAGLRLYTTEIVDAAVIAQKSGKSLIRICCRINEGFRHQVRAHLAYSGFPVFGDAVYNAQSRQNGCADDDMLFFASGISFVETDGTPVSVRIPTALMDEKAIRAFSEIQA